MPKVAIKVQNAPNKTRWTLAQHATTPTESPASFEAEDTIMQASGQYFEMHEPPLPRYESYDGSQYDPPSFDRKHSGVWNGGSPLNGHDEEYDYDMPLEERASHQISLNTRMRSQNHNEITQHLLYETAMMDSQDFEVLDMTEVDALKKEHARLVSRIEAASRKLAFESKVRDAAQNLQRLYSVNKRPDTPQSPDGSKKSRGSLLGGRRSSSGVVSLNGTTSHQAEAELATSVKMVDELNNVMKGLLERRQLVEGKLLRHTAAVLAEQASRSEKNASGNALTNGNHVGERHVDDEDDKVSSIYSPDEFDGIRDIIRGGSHGFNGSTRNTGDVQQVQEEHEQQMASVQGRLEQLNSQLRHVIEEASRTRGVPVADEPELEDHEHHDKTAQLDQRFARLDYNLHVLEQEQRDAKVQYAQMLDGAHMTRNAVEEQLATMNERVHHTLLLGADMMDMESLRQPPQATGHGYQHQLQYLEESLMTMERLLRQHGDELHNAREASGGAVRAIEEAQAKASTHANKVDEYEATLGGLWEILQSGHVPRRPSAIEREVDDEHGLPSPGTPLKEDFSLQAFSARVQHIFDRAQSAKEQHDILRRQIQQQRELNGKSDAEKDRQLTELQTRHDQLEAEHGAAQEELSRSMAQHAQAEGDASQSRLELMNIMNEVDSLRRAVDSRQQERDDMARQLQTHQGHAASLQTQVESLEAQVSDLTDDARIFSVESDARSKELESKHSAVSEQLAAATSAREEAEQRHAGVQKDMEGLESEVVRLTTELTMARAELEGAYGSRMERAKEAQATEVASLMERNSQLTAELQALRESHETALASAAAAAAAQAESANKALPTTPDRAKELEKELQDMATDFQELAKESVQLEKERGQLEDLIDSLRERCDGLEAQLGDEKVRWLGVKSPTNGGEAMVNGGGVGAREMTSTMVLRQEFKKMMRETRAEGMKLLRAEQEQRRQAESELRRLRQANGALTGRAGSGSIGSTSATAASSA